MGVKNTGGGSQGKNTGGGCIWAAALPALGQLYSWEPRLQRGGILLANPDYTQRPRRQIYIDSELNPEKYYWCKGTLEVEDCKFEPVHYYLHRYY